MDLAKRGEPADRAFSRGTADFAGQPLPWLRPLVLAAKERECGGRKSKGKARLAGRGAAGRSDGVKVRAPQRAEEALEFLYRDPFPNASLIGLIERSASGVSEVEVRVAEDGTIRGVLVVAPGPEAGRSAGLDAEGPDVAAALLGALPARERLQVGLHRPEAATVLSRICTATPTGMMLAFRCDGPWLRARSAAPARELTWRDQRAVRQSGDEPFLHSFSQAIRGRPAREETEVHTFGVVEQGRLVARCLTTWAPTGIERQIGTVWSVFTEPGARARGLGRAVVAAATAAILNSGRVARYFAFADNTPSLRICRSLGYAEDHAVRYFWAERRD
jgi:GNAT superfamily N-acetyltransferase